MDSGVELHAQRLVRLPLDVQASAVRLVIDEAWGNEHVNNLAWRIA